MAVIFSKEELDYKTLNEQISKSNATSYEGKIKAILGDKLVSKVRFTDGQTISFNSQRAENQSVVAIVFEMKKK